jgi:hypothetical protein
MYEFEDDNLDRIKKRVASREGASVAASQPD